MEQLKNYLISLRGDVFKLLPMRESELKGLDNHTHEYVGSLVINLEGAMVTYPVLATQKKYLYVINKMQYIRTHPNVKFAEWRSIILNATRSIDDLYVLYGGERDVK